jgi:hypothetical protein
MQEMPPTLVKIARHSYTVCTIPRPNRPADRATPSPIIPWLTSKEMSSLYFGQFAANPRQFAANPLVSSLLTPVRSPLTPGQFAANRHQFAANPRQFAANPCQFAATPSSVLC